MNKRNSTFGRLRLLTRALQGDKNIPTSFTKACRSQGGFAKYSCPLESIESMALNTLKSCAEQFIENGGWASLDQMRRTYLATFKAGGQASISRVNQATRLKDQLNTQKEALEMERRYRIRLQVAYEALLDRMRSMANNDPDIAQFINRHVTGFSFKRLSLTITSGSTDDP